MACKRSAVRSRLAPPTSLSVFFGAVAAEAANDHARNNSKFERNEGLQATLPYVLSGEVVETSFALRALTC